MTEKNLNNKNNKNKDFKNLKNKKNKNPKSFFSQILSIVIFFLILFLIYSLISKNLLQKENTEKKVSISEIVSVLETNNLENKKQNILIEDDKVILDVGTNSKLIAKKEVGESFLNILKNYNISTNTLNNLNITIKEDSGYKYLLGILTFIIPILFLGLMIWFLFKGVRGANMQAMNFGNTKAKFTDGDDEKNKITFKDVAGAKEAKQDLEEMVDFLKNPKKFLDIGAKIPRGVLLTGHPGTGKTLLAKAVAGEAKVPFFYLSGSEFVEMFVGVGASRVRDLFQEAKKHSPCIIFIDEIDAVGRARGVGLGGGNDEREQTLNQILVEMDGFEATDKLIIIAATNRPDVLDKALLRPGRFDRVVKINLPDKESRLEILEVHKKGKKFSDDINLKVVAERTIGLSGAQLASILNEAAILAATENKEVISQKEIIKSIERVIIGPERKSHLSSDEEKRKVAYHEAGHALVASLLDNSDPVHKISIIPRGDSGGVTWNIPLDDKKLVTKKSFIDEIATIYGGYAAENEIYGDVSTGPSHDLQVITSIARDMIMKFGMSEVVGPIAIESDERKVIYGNLQDSKNIIGIDLANKVDIEIKRFCEEGLNTAKKIIKENRNILDEIVKELLEKENLEREEFEEILKKFGIKIKS